MKKLNLIFLLLFAVTSQIFAQTNITFKTRYRIYIPGNDKFPIMYSGKKQFTQKVTGVINKPLVAGVDTFKTMTYDWAPGEPIDFCKIKAVKYRKYLYADILQSEDKDKLYIYFWPFNGESRQYDVTNSNQKNLLAPEDEFNNLVANGNFYIELKDRQALRFTKAALHAGAITMPLKVYLLSRDTSHASNVVADVNAGVYFGWKWGKETFRNMPGEKTAVTHQKFVSLNFIGGFSKIDISSKTNIKGDAREGTAIGFSPALGLGYHYDSFAVFVAAGTDVPFGNITENWRYKYKPWLGFGLGFSIL